MRRENELLQILAAVCLFAFGISATGIPCPKSPGFRSTDVARENCEEKWGIRRRMLELRGFSAQRRRPNGSTAL